MYAMPLLKNARHEYFASGVASGLSATQAYIKAGYSEKGAGQSAERLLKNAEVRARVEELKASISAGVEKKAVIDKAWVIKRLVENIERATQTIEVIDREGKPTGEYKYEGNVANRALELVGKELGMFVERKEVKSEVTVYEPDKLAHLSSEELGTLEVIARKLTTTRGDTGGN